MDTNKNIQGFLECDGIIVKISSMEDLKNFIVKFGKSVNEISESELDELTDKVRKEDIIDECGVRYFTNPLILYGADSFNSHGESYKIKEGTIAIQRRAFSNETPQLNINLCWLLKTLYIPDSVIAIGENAFYNQKNLEFIHFSDTLIKIGNQAFAKCGNLLIAQLPTTLKYIGVGAFEESGLSEIEIPKSVKSIGSHAFYNCQKIKRIVFAGVPQSIGSGVIERCPLLKEIIVPKNSKSYFRKELFSIGYSDIIIEE